MRKLKTPGFDHASTLIELLQTDTVDGLTRWADGVRKAAYNASTVRLVLSAARSETDERRREVLERIGSSLGGDRVVAEWPTHTGLDGEDEARGPLLTNREQEVALLAGRLSNADIAERLSLSPRTVENHLARAMRKAGVTNRHELFEVTAHSSAH